MAKAHGTARSREAFGHRLKRMRESNFPEAKSKKPAGDSDVEESDANALIDCGWGRLLFGHTFKDPKELCDAMRAEGPDRRDIAFYIRDPHVVLAAAPQELFLDPSHSYRLDISTYRSSRAKPKGFFIRRMVTKEDAEQVNRIFAARSMVQIPPEFFWSNRDARAVTCFVAEDDLSGKVIGTVTGVDHVRAFNDPEHGSSLWCLAVDPQARQARIGDALVRRLADHFAARGAAHMDLSVLHDNEQAIALYEKLGFRRLNVFAVKRKNPINEKLYTGPDEPDNLNPYAAIVVDEARRRGIRVKVTDEQGGFFRLTYGGRTVHCRESLSELTSAVAMSICDDKVIARRIVERAGLKVPAQLVLEDETDADNQALRDFIACHGSLVVKPARGEQGRGIAVGVETVDEMRKAVAVARQHCDRVIVEECVAGMDLRLIVIDFKVVAGAIRRPAHILGDGNLSVRELIEQQSRRRAAATGGESVIVVDEETKRCLASAGRGLDDVPADGEEIQVRKTANLHTGGTIHDVTAELHPALVAAAVNAAQAIDIPVVGIDFIVKSPSGPHYAFIEANERPGLANHEPQPTAERFVDLLFPHAIPTAVRATRD